MKRLSSDQTLTRGRLNAVTKLRTLLLRYGVLSPQGDHLAADEIRRTVVEEPFSAVFASVLRASRDPGARDVLDDELVDVISRHPAMHDWLDVADEARLNAAKTKIDLIAKKVRVAPPT